jgi:hypothetical protein
MPAAISRFPSSLLYGNVTSKVTSLSAVLRKAFAGRKIQGNSLGMIPEWQDACQSKRNAPLIVVDVCAIEIFHV